MDCRAQRLRRRGGQFAQDGRLVARPEAHFQHAVARLERCGLHHQRHDKGLADRLAFTDGQRRILGRILPLRRVDKLTAVDGCKRAAHATVGYLRPRVRPREV